MLVAIAYCHKDQDQASRFAAWLSEIGPFPNHSLLVARDRRAAKVEFVGFKEATEIVITDDILDKWPDSASHAFRKLGKHVEYVNKCPWLFLEPDAVILRGTAFDELEAEYVACKKPFLGDLIPDPIPHSSGIAVYPAQLSHYAGEVYYASNEPFDIVAGPQIAPQLAQSELIFHQWKAPPFKDWADFEARVLSKRPKCAIYHSDKTSSLIDLLRLRNNLPAPVLADVPESNHTPRDHSLSVNDSIGSEAQESTTSESPVAHPTLRPDSCGGQLIYETSVSPNCTLTFPDANARTVIVENWNGQSPWESRDDSLAEIRAIALRLRQFQTDAAKIRVVREELHNAGVIKLAYRHKKRKGWRKKRHA